MAVKQGFRIDPDLRVYGQKVREGRINPGEVRKVAERYDIDLYGGRGVIGALAAVALAGLPNEILLDPEQAVPVTREGSTGTPGD
jgi:tRNA(Ile2) C34 agmatinyltransferase TiaS